MEWARDTGGLVIEDDYDGEFRYDRQPVGALQALAPEHVVYAGTASKSLAPGFRLGWLVLPASLVGEVIVARELTDRARQQRWTSSRWPSSSPPAAMTDTSAGPGWPTGGAGTGWPLRWSGRPRGSG